jgi:hypothetical protein
MKRILIVLMSFLLGCVSLHAQTVKDSGYRTVAHIKSDGTIQDSSYRTIGHIKDDGTVQDANYRIIGHAKDIPQRWAAFYFFFLE